MEAETMTEVEAWVYLVTIGLPFLVAVINRPSFSATLRRWIQIGVTVVVAVVLLWLQGDFVTLVGGNVLQHVVTVVGLAQVWYTAISAIPVGKKALDKVEVATTPHTDPTLAAAQVRVVKQEAAADFRANVLSP